MIEAALVDALKHGTRAQRIRAAESLLKVALTAERLDVAEDRTQQQASSREELLGITRQDDEPWPRLLRLVGPWSF